MIRAILFGPLYVCDCMCVCIYIYVYIYIYMNVKQICIYLCLCIIYVHMCICIYVCGPQVAVCLMAVVWDARQPAVNRCAAGHRDSHVDSCPELSCDCRPKECRFA